MLNWCMATSTPYGTWRSTPGEPGSTSGQQSSWWWRDANTKREMKDCQWREATAIATASWRQGQQGCENWLSPPTLKSGGAQAPSVPPISPPLGNMDQLNYSPKFIASLCISRVFLCALGYGHGSVVTNFFFVLPRSKVRGVVGGHG